MSRNKSPDVRVQSNLLAASREEGLARLGGVHVRSFGMQEADGVTSGRAASCDARGSGDPGFQRAPWVSEGS